MVYHHHPSNEISCPFDLLLKMCAHRYLLCEHFACSYLSYVEQHRKKTYQLSKRGQLSQIFIRQQITSYHGSHILCITEQTPAV